MDFIWVPESGIGKTGNNAGTPVANELALFLCGFVVLAGCAALGSAELGEDVTATAAKFGMAWVIDFTTKVLEIFPWLGYLFVTTGALIGVSRSAATMKRRLTWFACTQAAAVALWFVSTLH